MLRRRTATALADVLGSMGVQGVQVAETRVRVFKTGPDEFTLRTAFRLRGHHVAGPPQLVVTAPESHLDTLTVTSTVLHVLEVPHSPNVPASVLLLDLAADKDWDGAEFEAVYRWIPGVSANGRLTGPRGLVLPHGLHTVRSEAVGATPIQLERPQARLQLDTIDGLDVWAVPATLTKGPEDVSTSMLEAVLFERPFRHPAMGPGERNLVTVSPTLRERLPTASMREVVHDLTRALSFLGDWFATGIPCSVLLVHPLDTIGRGPHRPGPLILGVLSDKPALEASTPSSSGHLAFWAAGIWCGSGFQLHGGSGPELMSGICQALALEWLRVSAPVEYKRAHRTYARALNRSWLSSATRDVRAFLNNHSRPTAKDSISIALSDGFARDPNLARWLAGYIRMHWGWSIDSRSFLQELATRGITFPRGVLPHH